MSNDEDRATVELSYACSDLVVSTPEYFPPLPIFRKCEPRHTATLPSQRTESVRRRLLRQGMPPPEEAKLEAPLNAACGCRLIDVISAYVKRTRYEEVEIIREAGGTNRFLWDLCVVPQDGLESALEVQRRAEIFGRNEMPRKGMTAFWRLLWDAGADPMLRILMVAAIVSLALGIAFGENPKIEWIEGAAIFMAVLIVMFVTALNDYFKERQFAHLYSQEEKFANAVRDDGQLQRVKVEGLVVGDIILLETGDEIPADALVLSCHTLAIDESSLTGESDAITKKSMDDCIKEAEAAMAGSTQLRGRNAHHQVASPVLLSGSVVTNGTGKAVVVAVGIHSQVGKLFTKLAVDTEPTPLQNKLNALARDVGKIGFLAALVTLVVLVTEYFILGSVQDEGFDTSGASVASAMVDYVVIAITIIVVAVPEGLPLAVTISLAFSVGRMLKDQNYVRKLAACETMGGANEICSDKTGTLTKNQMEVEAFWNGSVLSGNITSSSMDEVPLPPPEFKNILAENIAANSTGYLEKHEVEIADGTGRQKEVVRQVGSPTECALLLFIQNLGYDYDHIRRMYSGIEPYEPPTPRSLLMRVPTQNSSGPADDLIVQKIPFTSDRKAMSTVVKHPTKPGWYRLLIKGAAEVVLRRCAFRVDSEGELKALTETKIDRIESVIINQLASLALRTICLAFRDFDPNELTDWQNTETPESLFMTTENQLVCLGIAGIRDPVREEVPGAVRKCQAAGIRVRMCTGDNIETAKQIALKACIYHPEQGGIAMLGPDFLKLVGGVVCAKCKTEKCPCEGAITDLEPEDEACPANLESEIVNDDDDEKQKKCCRPKKKGGQAKPQAVVTARMDELGDPEAFERIADKLEVLARSQPTDKYALVTGLKNRGAIVAVTGDGTNDAPALKKADVGFAMGITGKEVAKQAADIVLLDDNFESIVRACKWGRNIYDNIQRFLQFQLTVNAVAVLTAFIGAVVLRQSPLSAVQLLWVNLIMDTFAALALATELPTDKLLDRPPHSRTEYLVSKTMFRNIIGQVIYQFAVMLAVIFSGECWLPEFEANLPNADRFPEFSQFSETCGGGRTVRSGRLFHPFSHNQDYRTEWTVNITPSRHYTYVFNIFVFMQAFNLLNARKIGAHEYAIFRGVFSNKYWIAVIGFIVGSQIILVEFGGYALNCHIQGLTWQQWLLCLAFGFGTWIVAFFVKLLPTRIVQALPETGAKEVNPLDEPTSLALASRGRISSGRISARMNLMSTEEASRVRASIVSSIGRSNPGEGTSTGRRRSNQVLNDARDLRSPPEIAKPEIEMVSP